MLYFAFGGATHPAFSQITNDTFLLDAQENSPSSPVIDLPGGYRIIISDNLYKVTDQNGKNFTANGYQKVGWVNGSYTPMNGYIGYKNNDLWGLLHLKSARTTAPAYTSVIPYDESLIVASKREKNTIQRNYGLITTNEKAVISFEYSFLSPAGTQLVAAKLVDNKNRYGLINKKEGTIIPFIYRKISALGGEQVSVVNDENKAALFSNEGVQLTPFEFDSILTLDHEFHLIDKNGKKGVINTTGKVIVVPGYKKITRNKEGTLRGLPFPGWDLLTADNRLIQKLAYDTIIAITRSLLKATIGPYEYLIDHKDHPVTNLEKRKYGEFKNGYATFAEGDGYGAIANYNEQIIPAIYDAMFRFDDYFVTRKQVSQHSEWAIYNRNGIKINKISYDQIGELSDGYFSVKKNGVWGFVNEFGHEIVKARYDSVFNFNQGIARVYHRKKYGVIDEFGRYLVPLNYHMVEIVNADIFLVKSHFNFAIYTRGKGEIYKTFYPLYADNGFIIEKTNSGKVGLFDQAGQRILTSEYEHINVAVAGRLHVFEKDGKKGLLNRSGGILMSLKDGLQEVRQASEDFIGVRINKKYGFIDFNGKLRIANRYDSIGIFSESMAPVNLLGKWGYIDKIERIKIQPKYQVAGNFKNETAVVGRNNQYGIIHKSGKEVVKLMYDNIVRNEFGNYHTFKGKKVGLVRNDGYEIIFPKYESVTDVGTGYYIIGLYGKFGLINEKGSGTIPIQYEELKYDKASNLFFGLKTAGWEKIVEKN